MEEFDLSTTAKLENFMNTYSHVMLSRNDGTEINARIVGVAKDGTIVIEESGYTRTYSLTDPEITRLT